jgi:hypothetical protein
MILPAGKSEFIVKLLEHRDSLFSEKFHRVIYCQPESLLNCENNVFSKIKSLYPHAEIHFGLPNINKLHLDLNYLPSLVIIDDLMTDLLNSYAMIELFSVHVHHYKISVIFTLHNFFATSRYGKTIARNVQYKIFFYNRVDKVELKHFSSQIFPSNTNFLLNCFKFIEKKFPEKYKHYIVIDGHSKSKISQLYV